VTLVGCVVRSDRLVDGAVGLGAGAGTHTFVGTSLRGQILGDDSGVQGLLVRSTGVEVAGWDE
jgi:hypothetical protein